MKGIGKVTPLWINRFRGLPNIPKEKLFNHKGHTTEQEIFFKLLHKKPVTVDEVETYKKVLDFYRTIIPLLQGVDFSTFNKSDFIKFKGYVNYIFNFEYVIWHQVKVFNTVRVVNNESVLGKRETITNKSFLKYPPLDVVKRIGKYNRASNDRTTLFYSTDSINSALMEIKPKKGDLITIGLWENMAADKNLTLFPINFGKEARRINEHSMKGYEAFLDIKGNNHELLGDFLEILFDFLGEEYSKPVSDHIKYYFSAYFTGKVLRNKEIPFDGVIYPSVQNQFKYENIAIKPESHERFELALAIEMEVEDTDYTKIVDKFDMLDIHYILPKNMKATEKIDNISGHITW